MSAKDKLRKLIIDAWKDGNMQYNPTKGSIDYDADIEVFLESFKYKIDELCEGKEPEQSSDEVLHKHLVMESALPKVRVKHYNYKTDELVVKCEELQREQDKNITYEPMLDTVKCIICHKELTEEEKVGDSNCCDLCWLST